jgi:hypothetical protein
MKKLFLDTEFTDLRPDNQLISIALVSENGKWFYAELTDSYERCECSDFVMNFVLPFLKGGEYRMTENECALKMATWIEELGDEYMIACDNISWDLPHLHRLLNKTRLWPENLSKTERFKFMVMDDDAERIVMEYDFDIHNALDDAKAMQIAYIQGQAWEY